MEKQNNTSLTLFKWTLFTTLGWIAGLFLAAIGADPFEIINLAIFWIGLGISIGIGLLQWVILRKQITKSGKWILFSVIGMGGIFLILNIFQVVLLSFNIQFMGDGISFIIPAVIGTSIGGYISGFLQEKYILRKSSMKPNHWASISFLGWFCSSLFLSTFIYITMLIKIENNILGPIPSIIIFLSAGPILGLCTGRKIISILKHTK